MKDITDEELLRVLSEHCARLHRAAMEQAEAGFVETPDDPRWSYAFPLRSDLQLIHLFIQMADAFDVAATSLRARTSAVGIGAIRFLAEGYVLIRWLAEPSNETERRKRAYRFALGCTIGTQGMLKHTADADPRTMRSLAESIQRLQQIAKEDGIQHVREAPKMDYLFKSYIAPGYVVFSSLSEIGSHPGLLQILVFYQDRRSRRIDVNLAGSHDERAAWLGAAYDFFGRSCDEIGKRFGWEEWLRETAVPLVREATPLMAEAKARWTAKWGLNRPTQPEP